MLGRIISGLILKPPHRYAELVLSIIRTHNPNWADLQAMLDIFLMAEERPLMVATGKKQDTFPDTDPQLSIQNYESQDYEKLNEYQDWMVQALRTAFPK